MDSPVVTVAKSGAIAVVTIDRPPVNALSASVRRKLLSAFDDIARDGSVAGVVLACAGRRFVAGADISEFGTDAFDEADLNDVCAAIEGLDKFVVCALHGTTLGGGMELALACHHRVAAPSARLGLPEVTLGLLPGAGGTQRLPRLIGAADALDMILSGAVMFVECMNSPEAVGLRHAFYAEREAGKVPGLAKGGALRPIDKVGIVGAGTMGGGIAMNFAINPCCSAMPAVTIKARLDRYAAQRGNTQDYWTAANLLCDLAATGRSFGNASPQSEASSLARY